MSTRSKSTTSSIGDIQAVLARTGDLAEKTFYETVSRSIVNSTLQQALQTAGGSVGTSTMPPDHYSMFQQQRDFMDEDDEKWAMDDHNQAKPIDKAMKVMQDCLQKLSNGCMNYHRQCPQSQMTPIEKRHYETFHPNLETRTSKYDKVPVPSKKKLWQKYQCWNDDT